MRTLLIKFSYSAIFVLVLCVFLVENLVAQTKTVTINEKNITLNEFLTHIRKQTGYNFTFSSNKLDFNQLINPKFKNISIQDVLSKYFNPNTGVVFIIKNGTIVLMDEERATKSTITGKIIEASTKRPVAGATIISGSQKINTKSGDGGLFQIVVPEYETFIEVSYLGLKNQRVIFNNEADILIELEEKTEEIENVVVTGLFSRPTENFTGAATAVTGDQLRNVNSMNVFDALKVFDPAVRIPDNLEFGSDPNQLPKISLRGTNNFPAQGDGGLNNQSGADFMAAYQSNPSMPLFMLDGFEASLQKIYDLDINRIDKITILKDAVATSAYGSRAANGVIVVETKQPQAGKLTVNYTSTLQVTAPDLTSYNLLNAADKLKLEQISGLYNTNRPENQLILDQRYSNRMAAVASGVDTYWLSQPLQTGVGTKQSIYVEGGDSHIRYGASAGYTNNKGVMKGSGRETFEGGMILSYRKNNFIVRNQLNINSNTSDNSPYGNFSDYSRLNPYWNPFDENGNVVKTLETIANFGIGGTSVISNPLYNATVGTVNYSKYTGITNNTFLEWRFNGGYRITGKLGLTKQNDEANVFLPAGHTAFANITDYNSEAYATRGSYDRSNSSFFNYDASLVGDYSKTFGKNLIFATLGFSVAEQQSQATAISVIGFPNNRLDEIFYGNAYRNGSRPSGQNNISRRFSSFANFNYTYDRRFLFDLALNIDGSTQFGELNRYAPFGAVGFGWNIHEEKFMQSALPYINRLKIRGGLGTTGSQQFPPYMAITTYGYNTGQDYLGSYGASVLGYGNQNLKWQETLKYNMGADLAFGADRFILRLDAYYEITNNLLLDVNTPPSLGVSTYKENMGKLANKGIEGNLNAFIFKPGQSKVSWSVFVNAIHNRNEIKEISNALKKMNEANDQNDQNRPQQRYQEGKSVNSIWAVLSAGIDPSTGQELFYDRNGQLTYVWNAEDKVIVGDGIPKVSGNLGTNMTYKGIQFGAYFSYQLGAKQYNQTLVDHVENANLSMNVDERVLLDRWTKPGDVTFFKGLSDVEGNTVTSITNATSRFMQKNNFLNFTSISLGYILPEAWTSKWKLKNTRLNLQGNNIFQMSSIQVERGLAYPFARNFTFSLNTSF